MFSEFKLPCGQKEKKERKKEEERKKKRKKKKLSMLYGDKK